MLTRLQTRPTRCRAASGSHVKHDVRARQVDVIARMPYSLPCSAFQNLNMDGLLERMWTSMALVRVYTKRARPRAAAAAAGAGRLCWTAYNSLHGLRA